VGKLVLKCGNILDYLDGMDAIVNSANKYMIYGSGVCGLIYRMADKDRLEEYCKINFKERMKLNEVRITKGFNLGLNIIHIYCPKYYESNGSINELLKSYENVFISAKEKGYMDIISISLGTGLHGYKHNEVAKEVINILNKLVSKYDINFHLVLANEEIMKIYKCFSR
jgi:O-acetyl-ADP-ribose deacetylase (regulator of RNase III)